ncbi:MAG: PAS domain S-box protein [Pyrinomonadaceae bacterium]
MKSSAPRGEAERLASLREYRILDTLPEQDFDDLTRLAAQICGVPIAQITFIDSDRQWFKSNIGIDASQTSRDISFCAHAIQEPDLFVVPDALQDKRFADNPLVISAPNIRFYAGAPLVTSEGQALGTLCVIDRVPRELSAEQQEALRALGRQVMTQLELRRQAGTLAKVNEDLEREVAVRKVAEESLLKVWEQLAERVKERTRELTQANASLLEQISERERVETSLRASEERFRSVTQSALDAIISADSGGHIVSWNKGAEIIFGYGEDEALGQFLTMLMPERYRAAHTHGMARFAQTGEAHVIGSTIELKGLRKDGSEFPVEISISAWKAGDESFYSGIIRDITERKRVADALRESEQRYRLLGEGILHQVWTAQPNGDLDYVNTRTLEYFGRTMKEAVGDGWLSVVHPDDAPSCVERWTQSLQTGQHYEVEFRLRSADGAYRWHLARATPGRDADGKIVKWFGTNTDIDVQKRAEESLLQSEEQLLQAQKMESIGTLAGGVAHDFNNLLTAILGNTQLGMRKLPEDDPLRPRLIEIEKAANRAAALTRQLLAFSRRQRLERKGLNLNETINETLKMLQRIIGEDIEVRFNAAGNLSTIYADPGQIEQVVMNLAVNARDAMPRGGRLAIETNNIVLDAEFCRRYPDCKPGKYAQLMVSDTGTGMDAETRARIFEPFFTTKEVGKGTGLGLSMVYGIIKQHEGLIHVYSEVGHGTTFKIYLPIEEKKVANQETEAALAPMRGGTETILVAEDEEALRELAQSILEELGYRVILAQDGAEAIEMYETSREKIDLVLLDVMMPRMGGYEAYERMRSLRSDIPVIFMTGYGTEQMQSKFIEASDAPIIQKPYSVEALGRVVRTMLDVEPSRS